MILRKGLHALGWRYRLHDRKLPGKPDLVFPGKHAVIFVNGCFWHGHDCHLFKWPKSRDQFWRSKISCNVARDQRVRAELQARGWRIADVWECMLKGRERLPIMEVLRRCEEFLSGDAERVSIGAAQTVTTSESA